MTTSIDSYSREETVNDILLRLPVKSLLRFKCVCKSWHDLIKSSSFIKKHFDNESNRPRLWFCKFGVDYRPQPPLRAINFFLLPEKIIAGVVPARQRIYRCEGVSDFRGIYGPVDGLFLLEKGIFYLMFGLVGGILLLKSVGLFLWYNLSFRDFSMNMSCCCNRVRFSESRL